MESRTSHTRTSLLEGLLGRLLPHHLLHREGRGLACFDTRAPPEMVQAQSRHRHMPVRQVTSGWSGGG